MAEKNGRLAGKVAIVTGAATGIGRAIGDRFHAVLVDNGLLRKDEAREARGARARGRVFPHVQPYPRCPTIAQGQLWENRKFPVSKFWIPVVRLGPPLPFLALSSVCRARP